MVNTKDILLRMQPTASKKKLEEEEKKKRENDLSLKLNPLSIRNEQPENTFADVVINFGMFTALFMNFEVPNVAGDSLDSEWKRKSKANSAGFFSLNNMQQGPKFQPTQEPDSKARLKN